MFAISNVTTYFQHKLANTNLENFLQEAELKWLVPYHYCHIDVFYLFYDNNISSLIILFRVYSSTVTSDGQITFENDFKSKSNN